MAEIIPNTENLKVAALAIAWEIVKITHIANAARKGGEEGQKDLTNAVIKTYTAIEKGEPIE